VTRQFLDPLARARAYVDKIPGAVSGASGHAQTFVVARALVSGFCLSEGDAMRLLLEYNARCSPPWPESELRHKVQSAIATPSNKPRGWLLGDGCSLPAARSPVVRQLPPPRAPVPITELSFDADKLAAIAGRITHPQNWRHWLSERSPKRPDAMNAWSFLGHLYRSGEIVLVFDKMESKRPVQMVSIAAPLDCRVPATIQAGGRHGSGIWFLCNPVDGQWHDTGARDERGEPILSCRNRQAVTNWRYAVLESDQAPADQWIAFVAQLPFRISALYTSGGRSVHCLIRIDATSKAEWDSIVEPLKRPLKVLGADSGCLSAVRLTRLPQCRRPEKSSIQKLLYLCPNPPLAPLFDLPVLFPRYETLARWRRCSPRWNPKAEPFA